MRRFLSIITLLVTVVLAVSSQNVTFTVNAPQRVRQGEKFAVTFRLRNAEGSGLKAPGINGCTLLYGPSVSTSMSYEVIGTHMSQSSTYDYTYYYIADKAGTFEIGEASVNADGKRMTTKPQTITVVASQGGNVQSGRQQRQQAVDLDDVSTQSADRSVSADDVFVRIILNRSSAYEQEAIECTIKLYTKYSISEFFATLQPSFDGFLIQEMDVRSALNEVETYKGQNYMTAVLKKCILFPQRSGKLTINSGNYDLKVVQYESINMGLFSVNNPRERKIKVSSNTASIDIKPLPFPQPEGFTGAVGTFDVDARLIGNSFRTNDPATLLYSIKGTGNIKYIKEPQIDFPSEFELYTPKSETDAVVQGSNVTGTMTVEYTFVPQNVGDFHIGSDRFVYFDPAKKEYVTLNTPTFDIKVAKGLSSPTSTESDRQDILAKNTDIRHIKIGDKHPSMSHRIMVYSWGYWLMFVIPVIGLVVVLVLYRRHIRRSADVVGRRHAKANKVARNRLKKAKSVMTSDPEKFNEELIRALWGYLGDKLGMESSQLTRDNVSAELGKYGAPEQSIEQVIGVIDDIEMARYAASLSESPQQMLERAEQAINSLEDLKI